MGSVEENDILKGDTKIQEACESIREHGDNTPDKRVWILKADGVEVGYRRQMFRTYINRQVFIKVPGYKISDISASQRERIMSAVFNVFLQPGSNLPTIDQIAPDCLLMQQQSVPMIAVERSPRLRSIAGGFKA
ncbi:MAG TPA: hypothetical protein VLH56_17305 [Dissulfurispiraceae bacterium]|nr:hypothetical protein [Dissulfurispiraceae bacterium]